MPGILCRADQIGHRAGVANTPATCGFVAAFVALNAHSGTVDGIRGAGVKDNSCGQHIVFQGTLADIFRSTVTTLSRDIYFHFSLSSLGYIVALLLSHIITIFARYSLVFI